MINLQASCSKTISFGNKTIACTLNIEMCLNWCGCSTNLWVGLGVHYRVGPRARVSVKHLLEIVIRIESLHSRIKWLGSWGRLQKGASFTWISSRLRHLWIKTCVLVETSTKITHWFCISPIEASIGWFRNWYRILFVHNNSYCATRNCRRWDDTICKCGQFIRMSRRSSTEPFGMCWRQPTSGFIIVSSSENFPAIVYLALLIVLKSSIMSAPLSCTEFVTISAHHYLSGLLCLSLEWHASSVHHEHRLAIVHAIYRGNPLRWLNYFWSIASCPTLCHHKQATLIVCGPTESPILSNHKLLLMHLVARHYTTFILFF